RGLGQPHHADHRPPAVDGDPRRRDPGARGRPRRRARPPWRAAGAGRQLRGDVAPPAGEHRTVGRGGGSGRLMRQEAAPPLAARVLAGDRRALAQAITLAESTRPEDRTVAEALVATLLPRTGGAVRIGISGPPGVGKSTLIERFGLHLVAAGHRIAVLAVDPSSKVSGGSILRAKSRMPHPPPPSPALIPHDPPPTPPP